MPYTISYHSDRFKQLSSKYKRLFSLEKENTKLAEILNGTVEKQYEDMYAVHIDRENGTLIFTHSKLITLGAASTDHIEYASVISFQTMKELLAYEINFWQSLVSKWETENDTDRATLCKKSLHTLETISNTAETNWISLIE